ncbi:hypothetical protein [Campylobacter mucosalis]|uniref:Putative membrane protein n=1 Tax=Campylobacter mucosalis CCUG 21559 TaxID=1032067 RepID=A0A6G5QE43_9BACT|nr:hypothetical protein [Campylobacter mucosalis]QCD43955.1 putative membrane protein [Campylobacter mucosalis CCUG 21559]QKF62305.1 putative membrane protein [Campylobacter mucosalis]
MKKCLSILFSWGFFVFAIALGVALWFLIDYLEQFRLDSAVADWGTVGLMALFFGLVIYAFLAIFINPFRSKIFACKCE